MKRILFIILMIMSVIGCLLITSCSDEPTMYTVTFDSDGGSSVDAQTVEEGNNATAPTVPTKDGYTFEGWYYGNDPWRFSLDSITSNVTLKAKWEAIQYSAKFYADGNLVDTVTFTCEDTALSRVPNVPNKNGHTGAWESFTLGLQDVTVNAIYTPTINTVTFDSNGGSNIASQTINFGAKVSEPTAPTKDGYVFSGWYLNGEQWRFNLDTVNESITLKAKWTPIPYSAKFYVDGNLVDTVTFTCEDTVLSRVPNIPIKNGYNSKWNLATDYVLDNEDIRIDAVYTIITYTITYNNLNGATNTNPTTYTVESSTITLTPLNVTGSLFNGWVDANGNAITAIPKGTYGDLNITAKWEGMLNVIFDSDGGTAISSQMLASGSKVTEPTAPTKTGYTFDGWYNGNEKWSFGGNIVTQDISLKAKWTPITYYARFYADNVLKYTIEFTVEDDELSTIPAVPDKNGYTKKWNLASDYEITANDMRIDAVYTKIQYTITYIALDGTTHSNPTEYDVETNSIMLSDPTEKNGYKFEGWYKNGIKVTSIPKGSYGDISLIARWMVKTYSISYNGLNGASISNPTSYTITSNDITLNAPRLLGYKFNGWTDASGNSVTIIRNGSHGNITLTANFEIAPEMSNFEFTSSANSCSILGLKNKTVTEIIVPDYVTKISMGAFCGCSNLTNITLPFIGENATATNASKSTLFGYIFGNSDYIGSTAITQYYSSGSTSFETFYIPSKLTTVKITSGNILYGAFYNCKGITNVTLPNNLTNIKFNAFYNCVGLKNITIPDSVRHISAFAFYYCTGLTSITIGNGVTYIGPSAFYYCNELRSVTIPDNVETIEAYAFYGCSKLESIYTSTNSRLLNIGNYAFSYCTELKSVTIPASIQNIGVYVFDNSSSSINIKYRGTETQWNAITKGTDWDANTSNYTITYNYTDE